MTIPVGARRFPPQITARNGIAVPPGTLGTAASAQQYRRGATAVPQHKPSNITVTQQPCPNPEDAPLGARRFPPQITARNGLAVPPSPCPNPDDTLVYSAFKKLSTSASLLKKLGLTRMRPSRMATRIFWASRRS